MIDSFRDEYQFLSNFYKCSIDVFGLHFLSSEAAFQSQKFLNKTIQQKFCSLSPSEAKHFSRQYSIRKDWEQVKIDVMREVLQAKFSDPVLQQQLIDTYPQELVEGNTWGDKFWGVCAGEGQNYLGKCLMELRDSLMEEVRHVSPNY